MTKIGEKPVAIKEGVAVSQEGKQLLVRGPLGEMTIPVPESLKVEVIDGQLQVTRLNDEKKTHAMHGTLARLIANAIIGTSMGFSKTLEVVGTGYRAQMEGETLVLALGYSHPIKFPTPVGVKIEAKDNKITVTGINKEIVGIVADKIKRFKMPDAYKGKGIRYLGEQLKLKPGKAAAKAGGAK
jgi:large subunit ribosomal protein L6